MLKLKTKWFNKWAIKNHISDSKLSDTLKDLISNLGAIDLGGGLYKVRTASSGKGKSGSFRTLVVFKESDIAIFVYGFSKAEKANLGSEELKYFKKLSKDLLSLNTEEYRLLEKSDDFIRIEEVS